MPPQSEEDALIKSVVDFTGTLPENAKLLLEQSNWNVPEAVSRFFHQVEAVDSASGTTTRHPTWFIKTLIKSIFNSLQSCMGWTWQTFRLFLFGPQGVRSNLKPGNGCMQISFPKSMNCDFKDACIHSRRMDDSRKILIVYLHSTSSPDFEAVTRRIICDETVASIISAQFPFWAGDTDYVQPYQLLRALPVKTTPLLLALVSNSRNEIRVLAACCGAQFGIESVLAVLQKAQEEQDMMYAEDEQLKIDKLLRQTQDREYQESLARDREIEEERAHAERTVIEETERKAREEAEAAHQAELLEQRKRVIKEELEAKVFTSDQGSCHLVVKLWDGSRIEQKFLPNASVAHVYKWVFACAEMITDENSFTLSTSYPNRKLIRDESQNLLELGLIPNAVLLCQL